MFRFLVRTIGLLALAAGFASLVIDGTKSIAASSLLVTAFGETCFKLFPRTFPGLQPLIEQNVHPLLWDPFLLSVLLLPTWLVMGLLGLLLLWLAQPRAAAIGFSSRP
ncbi:MAG: hypothetical protein JWN93_3419 [Hyphomicrobiales bacterium]|nr:hypothetical protein [Hyphomicrobiales bacterium]